MRDFLLRPIPEAVGGDESNGGMTLAGGPVRFNRIETLSLQRAPRRMSLKSISADALAPMVGPRAQVLGVAMDRPRLMGVLNVTPDSFSDGGQDASVADAVARGLAMAADGADFIDIGGESTRPGADPVDPGEEQARVLPVIEGLIAGLVAQGLTTPISIDTRNAATARAAMAAGAGMINDVSALTHDPGSLAVAVETGAIVCLMHARGDPKTMQAQARYDAPLIEVYGWLEERIRACVAAGLPLDRIVVDPGIGFGKTAAHNLALIGGLAAFHGLGAPVMLGASRKAFIGALTGEEDAGRRAAGSVGAALAGAAQGVHILRVHDVAETRGALAVWRAASGFAANGEEE